MGSEKKTLIIMAMKYVLCAIVLIQSARASSVMRGRYGFVGGRKDNNLKPGQRGWRPRAPTPQEVHEWKKNNPNAAPRTAAERRAENKFIREHNPELLPGTIQYTWAGTFIWFGLGILL